MLSPCFYAWFLFRHPGFSPAGMSPGIPQLQIPQNIDMIRQATRAANGKGNGREPLPSSATDSDWRLTLVNKWNPLPENDAVTLVEVPGGERVDERIYDPLMELLEAAKEENWNQLPTVVSGYRTREKTAKII